MTKKFGFLRFIAGFYKTLGIIVAILTVLGAIGALLSGILGGAAFQSLGSDFGLQDTAALSGILGGVGLAVAVFLGGALAAICQFAIGEAIMVFLAIEENTRATAGLLTRQS